MADALLLSLMLVVGRIALSFLPPGPLGSSSPPELPRTAAASLLVGAALLAIWSPFARFVELSAAASSTALGGLAALAWVARAMTSPGAMTPRHPPAAERAGPLTWLARAAIVALIAMAVARRGESTSSEVLASVESDVWTATAMLFATPIWIEWGLAQARRAPLGRALCAAAIVATPTVQRASLATDSIGPIAAVAAAGATFIAWRRRADRRALALCAIATALAASEQPLLALCAAALFTLYTPRPARASAAAWLAASIAIGVATSIARDEGSREVARDQVVLALFAGASDWSSWGAWWPAAALVLLLAVFGLSGGERRSRRPDPGARVDPPGRELGALAMWLAISTALALAIALARGRPWSEERSQRWFLASAPLVALLAGLVLVRDERAGGARPR